MDIENIKHQMKPQQYFSFKSIKDTVSTSEWTQVSRQAPWGTEEAEFGQLSQTTWLLQKTGKEEVKSQRQSHMKETVNYVPEI